MATPWLLIGLILAGELVFAVIVAVLTRIFSKHLQGQTFGLVVLGVAGVVSISGFYISWSVVLFLAACFAVAAIPMGIEYFWRLIVEEKKARVEHERLLDEHPSPDR